MTYSIFKGFDQKIQIVLATLETTQNHEILQNVSYMYVLKGKNFQVYVCMCLESVEENIEGDTNLHPPPVIGLTPNYLQNINQPKFLQKLTINRIKGILGKGLCLSGLKQKKDDQKIIRDARLYNDSNYGMKNSRIWPSTSTRKKHAAFAHKQSLKQKCKRERDISTYLRKVKLAFCTRTQFKIMELIFEFSMISLQDYVSLQAVTSF